MSKGGDNEIKETSAERQQATIGAEFARMSEELLAPLHKSLVRRVTDTDADKARLAGASNTATQQAFGRVLPKVAHSQIAAGAQPGSGRFNAAVGDTVMDSGASAGLGINDTLQAFEDQTASNRAGVINIGQGNAASGIAGMGRSARVAQEQAIADAEASRASRAATASLVGTAAGIGVGYASGGLGKSGGFSTPVGSPDQTFFSGKPPAQPTLFSGELSNAEYGRFLSQ